MTTNPGVVVVGAGDLQTVGEESQPTVERVLSVAGFDLCRTRLSAETTTGWHTHGDRTAYGVVLDGHGRLEFGPDPVDGLTLGPGDFFLVPPALPHREVATTEAWVALVGFDGDGPLVSEATRPATRPSALPRVARTDDLVPADTLANVTRLLPFPDASIQQIRGHAAPNVESGWHHHGDNHVFGYVVDGAGYMEWGSGPGERKLVHAGECFHLPPGVVHRDVNPRGSDQRYLLWLTGSDPRTVPVEGPTG